MSSDFRYVTEEEVEKVLNWDALFSAIEQALVDASSGASAEALIVQPARGLMPIPPRKGVLITMPCYVQEKKLLACKILTAFSENPTRHALPSALANIMLMDADTGALRCVMAGAAVTEWRTACASAAATRHLLPDKSRHGVLAVLGAGKQGRIHIIAFQHFFKFKAVHLWNRTRERGERLAAELREKFGIEVRLFSSVGDCTGNADVIVTATASEEPILSCKNIKPNALINAVGVNGKGHELDWDIYEKSKIYTDSMITANEELKWLTEKGFTINGEIGEVISGAKGCDGQSIIVFQSLGMALEDAVAAELVWDCLKEKSSGMNPSLNSQQDN